MEQRLRSRVNAFQQYVDGLTRAVQRQVSLSDRTRAAVLVPIVFRDDVPHVLLTRRSKVLRAHKGEVAFPGGKRDNADFDDADTALREAEEEIGLNRKDVDVIGQLLPVVMMSRVLVTPCVAIVNSEACDKLTINTDEVESVFYVPLERFLSDENHQSKDMFWLDHGKLHFFTDEFEGENYVTWGMTASVLISLAIMVYERNSNFECGYDVKNPLRTSELNLIEAFRLTQANL